MLSGGAEAAHQGDSPLHAALGGGEGGMKEWREGKGGEGQKRDEERGRRERGGRGVRYSVCVLCVWGGDLGTFTALHGQLLVFCLIEKNVTE